MSSSPLVTVALPVYNGGLHLQDAIDSILAQDMDDFELVIGDNGSEDSTEAICRRAAEDPRVRYERSPVNRGAAWNYNRLVDMARGRYFKWAAHDDMLAATFLRRCVVQLETHTRAVLAYPRTILIDNNGAILDPAFDDGLDLRDEEPRRRFRRYLVHPGEQHPVFGVVRLDALRRTGRIASCWGGDQVLLAELALMGEFHEIPERLFLRRYHDTTSLIQRTPEQVTAWYDTAARPKVTWPRTRLTAELASVAATSTIPISQRVGCLADIATRWTPRYAHVMAGELKRSVQLHLGMTPRPNLN